MMTCSTCTHFDPPATDGLILKIMSPWVRPYGVCRLTESDDGNPAVPDSGAVACDTEAYHAWLRVLPEFGCVQHVAVS